MDSVLGRRSVLARKNLVILLNEPDSIPLLLLNCTRYTRIAMEAMTLPRSSSSGLARPTFFFPPDCAYKLVLIWKTERDVIWHKLMLLACSPRQSRLKYDVEVIRAIFFASCDLKYRLSCGNSGRKERFSRRETMMTFFSVSSTY